MKKYFTLILLSIQALFHVTSAQGKIGINTVSPTAMLHVKDSSVVFTGGASLPATPGQPPVLGNGIRMMWYPDKAAIRAGGVGASHWDKDSIGNYSSGIGLNTIAKGYGSVALGHTTSATNTASVALGNGTVATGIAATALGSFTDATGTSSVSMGNSTIASGAVSVAMGSSSIASGTGALSIGSNNYAIGNYSSSFGLNTKARSYAAFVLGRYNDTTSISSAAWNSLDPLFIIGNGSSAISRNNALTVLKKGYVGINTSDPQAYLHVKDSSVVFTGGASLPATPGQLPVLGNGIRMMWYPEKAAFRAGMATDNSWNKDSIGSYSIAMGRGTKAIGFSSTAFGDQTKAAASYSTALGINSLASGYTSFAVGFGTEATNTYATAMGYLTSASGSYATAMGYRTNASGSAATAMGYNTTASGSYATAMGYNTTATGTAATAIGNNTLASGIGSNAMGYFVKASGHYSNAMGYITMAKSYASVALGRYNDTTSISSTSWNSADPVFIIGNGSSTTSRSNAFTVLKNGDVGIKTASPQYGLHMVTNIGSDNGWIDGVVIENTSSSTGEAAISFRVSGSSGTGSKFWHSGLNQNPDFRWCYGTGFMNIETKMRLDTLGNLTIDGVYSPSDATLKTGLYRLDNALEKILLISGYQYYWKDPVKDPSLRTGLLAQEIENVMPELVKTDDDGIKSVNYDGLIPFLVEAVKTLKEENEQIKSELIMLKSLLDN